MTQTIVAFTGISGVGKTTFLQRLSERVDFQHLTGGSLIAKAREMPDQNRDVLRQADLDENQYLLTQGFAVARDPTARFVIMDGHVIIDGSKGVSAIATAVFKALGATVMVHLETGPKWILQNRMRDTQRNRPVHSVDTLSAHQERSRQRAMEVASDLAIEFLSIRHEDLDVLADFLLAQHPRV